MKTLLIISALFLMSAAPAVAEVKAHELDGTDLRIPVSGAGTVAFRECPTCEFRSARISNEALFLLNGTTTSLDQIRQALAQTSDKGNAMITLFYDDDSQRVTRIVIRIR